MDQVKIDLLEQNTCQEAYFTKHGKYCQCLETEGIATKMNTLPGEDEIIPLSLVDKALKVKVHEKMSIRDEKEVFGYSQFISDGTIDDEGNFVWNLVYDSNPEI